MRSYCRRLLILPPFPAKSLLPCIWHLAPSINSFFLFQNFSSYRLYDLDFNRDKDSVKDILSHFADANGEAKYINILQDVANRKTKAIQIDLEDLFSYKDLDEEFLRRVTENTRRYIKIFANAVDELVPEPTEAPDDDDDILMTQRAD